MKPRAGMFRRSLGFAVILMATTAITDSDVRAANDGLGITKLKAQYKRPDSIPFPATDRYSDAKAQLGQTLFFDPRLSGPATMSCATCHNPALAWKDGLPRGVGNKANQLGRATPTILNLAWADLLMWDGRKDGLEDQASGPIEADAEMNLPIPKLIERLSAIPSYHRIFHEAFGRDEISKTTITQAIATFERTLVSNKAPFDRWIEGNERAIGVDAKHGFQIFNEKGHCAACHSGWRFTDDSFHDIGLKSEDIGRGGQVPDEPMLKYAFKTPTLRNVDQRAPYMHDGSVSTLRDVVIHYDTGFIDRPSLSPEMHRLGLTEKEIDDLVTFLHTLTSQDDPVTVPVLPTKEEG
jgi:cytochrome c peroxidase